jgi:hypothetical protein
MRLWKGLMILSFCASSATPAFLCGQPADGAPRGLVKLEEIKHLRADVDAWPLIANPAGPEEQQINSTLARLNERMQKWLGECDADYADWSKQNSDGNTDKKSGATWERRVNVTMVGPKFIAMVANDSQFCGGAYPNSDTFALVFDLATGKPVNWVGLIAPSALAKPYSDTMYDGTKVGTLIVPALLKMSRDKADADCKDAFRDEQPYQLWPDAKSGKLIAEPFGLPHVVAACGDNLELSIDEARKLGFDDGLLKAIEEAHRRMSAAGSSVAAR